MDDIALLLVALLAVVALIVAAIAFSERRRISKLFVKGGTGGLELSLEMHEIVQKEVQRISASALRRAIALDRKLLEFWENGRFRTSEESALRLQTIADAVAEMESVLEHAPAAEKLQVGLFLREAYWAYLRHAREHFASSTGYFEIRSKVVAGFNRLENLDAA
jgi:hypothetical protein